MLQMSVEPTANRAPVAQWIEHLTSDQRVGGSNPSGRATYLASILTFARLSTATKSVESSGLRVWIPLGRPVESDARDGYRRGSRQQLRARAGALTT